MLPEELERKITELQAMPLMVFCQRPDGITSIMSVRDCIRTGSKYISLALDELDDLLSKHLEA